MQASLAINISCSIRFLRFLCFGATVTFTDSESLRRRGNGTENASDYCCCMIVYAKDVLALFSISIDFVLVE